MSLLFRKGDPAPELAGAAQAKALLPRARRAATEAPRLEGVIATRELTLGSIGPLFIAFWPGAPTVAALELLDVHLRKLVEAFGAGLAYLAIVDGAPSVPTLEARQKIASLLKHHSSNFGVYPHVLLGGGSWIARPIMMGTAFLSGLPLPMPFFGTCERAASWLASGYLRGSLPEARDIVDAVAQLAASSKHARSRREDSRTQSSPALPASDHHV